MYAVMAISTVDIVSTKSTVSTVSQFMSKAGPLHWMAIKHIMRYLKGTLDFKLCLEGKDIVLKIFNVDWAGDVNDSRSTTGYMFFVGVGIIL